MLFSMDMAGLNLAIPQLTRDLEPSAGQLLWIIDIYGFVVAGFLLTMGAIGDRIGRRRILLYGAAAFGVLSAVAAFSQTASQLILARGLLGVAGATIAPSTLSLIGHIFRDPHQRMVAISVWVASFSLGAIAGPAIAGALIQYFWWGAIFLLGVPIMALLLFLGPFLLPEYKSEAPRPIDVFSSLLSLGAVLPIVYAVKDAAEFGLNAGSATALVLGVLFGRAFVLRQARLSDPMIDLYLFRSRMVVVCLFINFVAVFFMFGRSLFLGLYLQLVEGLTPAESGLWMMPGAIAFALASMGLGVLVRQFGRRTVLATGLFISCAGFAWLSTSFSFANVVAANVLVSIGFTPVIALTTNFVLGSVPVENSGSASAVSETAAELGGALGIALLGALMTVIYQTGMAAASLPNIPPNLLNAASSSLAAAVDVGTLLAPAKATELLVASHHAFIDAYQAMAWLAAASFLLLSLVILRVGKKS